MSRIRVTVNGCFDGLHPGHLFMLGYALAQGTELVVGINSDEYIQRHKGKVMVTASDRVAALRMLGFIAHVVVFVEDTPIEFLKIVRPEVHCTGMEYARAGKCAEAAWCKDNAVRLVFVPRVGNWSSTQMRNQR